MGEELATNPFARAPALRGVLDLAAGAPDYETFGKMRALKDNFTG